jgi:hypothetical protein
LTAIFDAVFLQKDFKRAILQCAKV